jgi:hypothetical protein
MLDSDGKKRDEAPVAHIPDASAPSYKIAYDEAIRALTAQAGVLDNIRTRAGMLITAANVVTAFLAPQAITNGSGFKTGAGVAIALFVACVAFAVSILWSRKSWRFTVDAGKVIQKIESSETPTLGDLHKWMAVNGQKAWSNNQGKIDGMFTAFRVGSVLLVAEVIAWIGILAKVNVGGVQW